MQQPNESQLGDTAGLSASEISRRRVLIGSAAALFVPIILGGEALARAAAAVGPREIPAHLLPVPDTISPEMRTVVGAPLPPGWDKVPATIEEWRAFAKMSTEGAGPLLDEIRARLGVRVERGTIAGVPVFISTPDKMPAENEKRLLMHLHGGGYVLFPGEIGAGEGMMMAGYGGFRVVSVDYRMSPDFPFPAGLEDSIAVWRSLAAENDHRRMAIFGTSAG
ncbi:MAG: alpha/beta hydrolase, partial [Rhizobiales bacterium]|nr:alpha/beta hydrolase [Hyphomicrobiales bacterium]